jgi:hexosaminidase
MKSRCLILAFVMTGFSLSVAAQMPALIPFPEKVDTAGAVFRLDAATVLHIDKNAQGIAAPSRQVLAEFRRSAGVPLRESASLPRRGYVRIMRSADTMAEGAYRLSVLADGVRITAAGAEGVFHACQTLLQLTPPASGKDRYLPAVQIVDAPAFPYRGLMLDVARHYLPVTFIRNMIDRMALLKMNRLHLHLTDDQGWRIPIRKYPLLTETGSSRNGTIIGRYPGNGSDNTPHGGYYTREELQELVRYAQSRFVEIIPEIDLPGHASAAIAAYPALSCFPEKATEVIPGMMAEATLARLKAGPAKVVQETWGVFNDVMCPSEFTFGFLNDVLSEVMDIFPSKYIHIGGDECPKDYWKKSDFCQELIRKHDLKDEHGLQSWFIRRLETMVEKRGRRIIGWDEILEGGLAPNATVMSWRGISGGIEAARQGHDVIMSPVDYCYLNLYQSEDPSDSIAWGSMLSLKKVYDFDPVPAVLDDRQQQHVRGIQANLWSEYINSPALAEFMLFPRLLAIAELGWRRKKTGFDHFTDRAAGWFPRMKSLGINHSSHLFELAMSGRYRSDINAIEVGIRGASPAAMLRYSIDGGAPVPYKVPFTVSSSCLITASAEVGGVTTDRKSTTFRFSKSAGRTLKMRVPPSAPYDKGQGASSVNGILGSDQRYTDPEWSGWNGGDMEADIDLGKAEEITSVAIRFFHAPNSWVYLPSAVELLASEDGISYVPFHREPQPAGHQIGVYEKVLKFPKKTMRYLRVIARNQGKIAVGNPGAGNPAWLFADEISVD